jgi:hypothetical protein
MLAYVTTAVCTTLSPGFTTSVMLTCESLLQSLHCPIHEIRSIRQAGSRIPAAVIHTALFTRFTVSVIMTHEFPLLSLHSAIHGIHSIYHAGS